MNVPLFLEGVRIDDMAQIAAHFDEKKLKADVEDGSLAEWLDEGGEEAARKRVEAMGGAAGDDFAERLIAALWPEEGSAEAQEARAHLAEARKREAEEARKRAEEEKRRKEREAREAAEAAQEKKEKAELVRILEKASEKRRKEESAQAVPDVVTVAVLQRRAMEEAPWAAYCKVKQILYGEGRWVLKIGLLDLNFKTWGDTVSLDFEGAKRVDPGIRNGVVFRLEISPQRGTAKASDAARNLQELLSAAQRGDKEAQWHYGCRLLDGWGHPELANPRTALTWLYRAADQNHAEAKVTIGNCYLTGKNGVKNSQEIAALWYRRAARQGNAEGEYCIGMCYRYGHGVAANEKRAVDWLRKAERQGHEDAAKELAGQGPCLAKHVQSWLGTMGQ